MPEKLDSCVEQVKGDGNSEDSAYAICTDSLKTAKHGKFSKADVAYSYRPPGQQCGGCQHYGDGSCAIVEGKIHPELGCDKFSMKSLMAKFTQNPDFPEPSIDIVTGEKKKTGFHSLMRTKIGSMYEMLEKTSQSGSKLASINTLKINKMKLQVSRK